MEVVEAPALPWILSWLAPYLGSVALGLAWLSGVRRESVYSSLSIASILASAIVSSWAAYRVFAYDSVIYSGGDLVWIPWLDVTLGTYFDGLSALMSLVVSWISLAIAVYSVKYMEGDPGYGRYFVMITFFVGSMMLLVLADNLILMFIGWEGTGIASYALIGHWYTDEEDKWVGRRGRRVLGTPMYFEPSHSAVRAVLFTRVGDLGFLFGIAAIYLASGTFKIPELAADASWIVSLAADGVLAPLLLIFTLGALAKSAQVPFHEWLVTAMTGPTPVSALIHAATMVKAGVYLVLRFTPIIALGVVGAGQLVSEQAYTYFSVVAWFSVATAALLGLMALVADELKLVLAYSTASQLGYMILGASAAGMAAALGATPEVVSEGVAAGMGHLVSHAIFKASLFLAAGWLIHVAHSRFIDNMGGYARYMKLTAASFWLASLSLAGVPPLSGFFSKELVVEVASIASTGLAAAALAGVALTAAYSTRLALRVFHLPPYTRSGGEPGEAPAVMLAPYALLALATLALGLGFTGFYSILQDTAGLTLGVVEVKELKLAVTRETLLGAGLALGGVAIPVALYSVARVDFRRVLESSRLADYVHGALYDRLYINPLIYLAVAGGISALSALLAVVDLGIDLIYHAWAPGLAGAASLVLRRLHRGRTDYYLAIYILSLAAMIVLVLFVYGG